MKKQGRTIRQRRKGNKSRKEEVKEKEEVEGG